MNKKHKKLMEDLSAIRPAFKPSGEEWAASERSRAVFSRIRERALAETSLPRRHWTPARVGWIAGTVSSMALFIAAVLYLSFSLGGGEEGPVSGTTMTTAANSASTLQTSTPSGAEYVSTKEAIQDILQLADKKLGSSTGESPGVVGRPNEYLRRAVDLGLVPSNQLAVAADPPPVTRAQFAVWLWKLFSPILEPRAATGASFSDLDALSRDERRAVERLAQAGVVTGHPDGTFRGHELLTKNDKTAFLAQIEKVEER